MLFIKAYDKDAKPHDIIPEVGFVLDMKIWANRFAKYYAYLNMDEAIRSIEFEVSENDLTMIHLTSAYEGNSEAKGHMFKSSESVFEIPDKDYSQEVSDPVKIKLEIYNKDYVRFHASYGKGFGKRKVSSTSLSKKDWEQYL